MQRSKDWSIFYCFSDRLAGAGLNVQQLALKHMSRWDICVAAASLTCYTTGLNPGTKSYIQACCSTFKWFIYLFVWKGEWQRRRERQRYILLLIYSANGHSSHIGPGWGQALGTPSCTPCVEPQAQVFSLLPLLSQVRWQGYGLEASWAAGTRTGAPYGDTKSLENNLTSCQTLNFLKEL